MKRKTVKSIIAAATALGLVFSAAGCGASSSGSAVSSGEAEESSAAEESAPEESAPEESAAEGESSAAEEETGEKTVITVGTPGTVKPFTYTDEDDSLTGFDIELLRAIFEKLPQYDLQFERTEFASVLTGVTSGLYQLGACNFSYSQEREETYQFSDPIFENQYVIAVSADNTDINSWADLAGKSTEGSSGLNYTTALENWNEANPDQTVEINYTESDLTTILTNVDSGKFDFQLIDRTTLNTYLEGFDFNLKAIELTDEEEDLIGTNRYAYYILEKSEAGAALAEDINGALQEVIAEGTATEISEKYLGGDYIPKE